MVLWQKIAIGLGGFACLGAAGGIVAFQMTSGSADEATAFVEEIAHAGPDAAYGRAAPVLRAAQSKAEFSAQMRKWRLTEAASESWPSRSYVNGQMIVVGSITLRSGEILPLRIELVKVGAKWEVSGLTLNAGAQDSLD